MNTRQLKHFLAVIDLRSLNAAAQDVHLSPAALSRSVRALETELRVVLFDRADRRLRPTPYALAYVDRARRIVFDEKEGARSLALMRTGELGPLAFGMGSSIAFGLMSQLMLKLHSESPGLELRATVETSDALFAGLSDERLDFFIGDVRVAFNDPRMTVEAVHACTFGWYARRGHPLAKRRQLSIDDVVRFPLIGTGYAHESHARRLAQLYGLNQPLTYSLNTNDVVSVHALVTSSDAVLPTTDIAMLSQLSAGTVVRLDVSPPLDLDLLLGIVRRTGRTMVPAAERAFEMVRAHFADVAKRIAREVVHRASPSARAKVKPASR
jgi:DNA-binding transcriptional LysR family regulator